MSAPVLLIEPGGGEILAQVADLVLGRLDQGQPHRADVEPRRRSPALTRIAPWVRKIPV